jgi:hypothetical protein
VQPLIMQIQVGHRYMTFEAAGGGNPQGCAFHRGAYPRPVLKLHKPSALTDPENLPATDSEAAEREQDSTHAPLSIEICEALRTSPEIFPFIKRLPSISSSPDMVIWELSSVEWIRGFCFDRRGTVLIFSQWSDKVNYRIC